MQIRQVLKNANKGVNLRGITFTPRTTQKKLKYQKLNAVAASSAVNSQEVREPGLTPRCFDGPEDQPRLHVLGLPDILAFRLVRSVRLVRFMQPSLTRDGKNDKIGQIG